MTAATSRLREPVAKLNSAIEHWTKDVVERVNLGVGKGALEVLGEGPCQPGANVLTTFCSHAVVRHSEAVDAVHLPPRDVFVFIDLYGSRSELAARRGRPGRGEVSRCPPHDFAAESCDLRWDVTQLVDVHAIEAVP